jgi:hypothetical protein
LKHKIFKITDAWHKIFDVSLNDGMSKKTISLTWETDEITNQSRN